MAMKSDFALFYSTCLRAGGGPRRRRRASVDPLSRRAGAPSTAGPGCSDRETPQNTAGMVRSVVQTPVRFLLLLQRRMEPLPVVLGVHLLQMRVLRRLQRNEHRGVG